jgi:hypothetical protein
MAASWNHHKVLFWSSHGHLRRGFQQQKIRRFPTQHQRGGGYPNFSACPHFQQHPRTHQKYRDRSRASNRSTPDACHMHPLRGGQIAEQRMHLRQIPLAPTHIIKCRWISNICADTIQRTLGDNWPDIVQHLTKYGVGGSRLHYHADDAAMDAPRPNQPALRPAGLSTPSCQIRITRADIAQGP